MHVKRLVRDDGARITGRLVLGCLACILSTGQVGIRAGCKLTLLSSICMQATISTVVLDRCILCASELKGLLIIRDE
jgi:hypothetical protein